MHRKMSVFAKLVGFFLTVLATTYIAAPTVARAFDYSVEGRVTLVEPTYMPGAVSFHMNVQVGNCPAGTPIMWTGRGSNPAANSQAVLQVLTAALLSGRNVRVIGANRVGNGACQIEYIHLL
jgi:hypothetical protein